LLFTNPVEEVKRNKGKTRNKSCIRIEMKQEEIEKEKKEIV
jgi:hypothetical protein